MVVLERIVKKLPARVLKFEPLLLGLRVKRVEQIALVMIQFFDGYEIEGGVGFLKEKTCRDKHTILQMFSINIRYKVWLYMIKRTSTDPLIYIVSVSTY